MKEEKRVGNRRNTVCRRMKDRRNINLHVENNYRAVYRRREASRRDSANDKRVSALKMVLKVKRKTQYQP